MQENNLFWRRGGMKDALGVLHTMKKEKRSAQELLELIENAGDAEWLEMEMLERDVLTIIETIERVEKVYFELVKKEQETL